MESIPSRADVFVISEKRTCKVCGKEFDAYPEAKKEYCSDACRYRAASPVVTYNRTCPVDNVQFTTTSKQQIYCSDKCYYRANTIKKSAIRKTAGPYAGWKGPYDKKNY